MLNEEFHSPVVFGQWAPGALQINALMYDLHFELSVLKFFIPDEGLKRIPLPRCHRFSVATVTVSSEITLYFLMPISRSLYQYSRGLRVC